MFPSTFHSITRCWSVFIFPAVHLHSFAIWGRCISLCVWRRRGPVTLLSVILFMFAVDCCHGNRQPITRSDQQGVGSGHLEPQEEQYLRLLPSRCLACFWLTVGGHVSVQLCRSDLKYLVERQALFWCVSSPPPDSTPPPHPSLVEPLPATEFNIKVVFLQLQLSFYRQ